MSDPKTPMLAGDQRRAVAPDSQVWLSASAGTGKTEVLSSRVLRLLLEPGVEPGSILCLTFTKAGASEMANRINARLASWVRMDDVKLATELKAIGAGVDPDTVTRARRLFAHVLDAPGGGLAIQTIHSFCQTLLAAFPEEAGVVPGFRPIEERDRWLLARETLAAMLDTAAAQGDERLRANLEELSLNLGPDDAEAYLMRCAAAANGLAHLPGSIRPWINAAVGLPTEADESTIALLCSDASIDTDLLMAVRDRNRRWGAKTGLERAQTIDDWLALDPMGRLTSFGDVFKVVAKQDGSFRTGQPVPAKIDPDYPQMAQALYEQLLPIRDAYALARIAGRLSRALEVGRGFAIAFAEAKRRAGVLDFDDQIGLAAGLLSQQRMADWVRFKLDRRYDHVLVDESQDTNAAQWDIVWALIEDFFAGEGSKPERLRTLFTVGDFKQAIFGFQGTSPHEYRRARDRIGDAAAGVGTPIVQLSLRQSFRSTQPVLDIVDATLAAVGGPALGLGEEHPERHAGRDGPGVVDLWPPVRSGAVDSADDEAEQGTEAAAANDSGDEGPEDEGEGGGQAWLSAADRLLAERIASRIADWLTPGSPDRLWLDRRRDKTPGWAGPGDIMVLLRSRADMMRLIVARLYARGVPVAGIDRLRLGQPLAVKDLMAAVRFALQPLDDLNLAALLVSPLIGWSQDDLLARGYRPAGTALWPHLRALGNADPGLDTTLEPLRAILAEADYGTPYAFLERLLSGPLQGRAKLVGRLGVEAIDPLGELLAAAQTFEANHGGGLQAFLHWFESGDEEIARELAEQQGVVRVMTVHGSKGLQAPVVILADAAHNPGNKRARGFELPLGHDGIKAPVFALPKAECTGAFEQAQERAKAAEMEEHWRLLYVAMTRAEERLVVTGTLGKKEKEVAEDSWYARIEAAMRALNAVPMILPDGATGMRFGFPAAPKAKAADERPAETAESALPSWALTPAPPEAKPPRPLAPSALGEDAVANPPLIGPAVRAAAQRGVALHSLFERLPDVLPAERREAADRWLRDQAGYGDAQERAELVEAAMAVLDAPDWAALFGPSSLAEVPVAALVGDAVVAGTIDRLVIEPDRVLIVDFKTTRFPPASVEEVPVGHRRQMAAYAAALARIYPGRRIDAALLYTAGPRLLPLGQAVLQAHAPGAAGG